MGGKTQIERERETTTTNNNTNTIIAWYERDNARGIHKTNSAVPTPTNVSFSSSRLSLYTHIFRGNSTPKSSLSLSLSAKRIKRVYSFSTELQQSATHSTSSNTHYCPCIFPKITCPLSMYLNAQ